MVSTTFVTPSPYHFDLSSDLNCRCERLSVCVAGSCLATTATRSPESFFLLILFFTSPSCAVILSHSDSQSLSLCLSVAVDAHMQPPSVSHTLAVCHISSHRLPFWFLLKSVGVLGIKLQSVYRRNFMSIISHPRR